MTRITLQGVQRLASEVPSAGVRQVRVMHSGHFDVHSRAVDMAVAPALLCTRPHPGFPVSELSGREPQSLECSGSIRHNALCQRSLSGYSNPVRVGVNPAHFTEGKVEGLEGGAP